MPEGFIIDLDMIQEDCAVEDLLDFSEPMNKFAAKLDAIDRPATIGLVGKFGIGKSTMLHRLKKEREEQEKPEVWIHFDAWKYPDRKDLWEGFALDFADQIGKRDKTLRKVDGKSTKSRWLGLATSILSEITDRIPEFGILEKFTEIFESSPATSAFQLQRILASLIESVSGNVVVVIEDADRSGDAGIYFLETLKQFLKGLKIEKKVVAIVPMGEENYSKHLDSYLKCLDYVEFFQPEVESLSVFVDRVFDQSLFSQDYSVHGRVVSTGTHRRTQLVAFLGEVMRQQGVTMRTLKLILRRADMSFRKQREEGKNPDMGVTICFETTKYLPVNGDSVRSHFATIREGKKVLANSLYAAYLFAIYRNVGGLSQPSRSDGDPELVHPRVDVTLVPNNGVNGNELPRIPAYIQAQFTTDKNRLLVDDFYLDY